MKILISNNCQDPILDGIKHTILTLDIDVVLWDYNIKPITDIIDEFQPDIFICHTTEITPSMVSVIKEYGEMKWIVFGLGNFDDIEPTLVCVSQAIPDTIQTNLRQLKTPHLFLDTASNLARFHKKYKYNEKHSSDILYISNFDITNRPAIIPILKQLINEHHLKIKIIGKYKLPLIQYLGNVDNDDQLGELCASTKIMLDFDGDMKKDCELMGVPYVIYYQNSPLSILTESINVEQEHLYNHRKDIKYVSPNLGLNNTYFHTTTQLFKKLQLEDLAKHCTDKFNEYKKLRCAG